MYWILSYFLICGVAVLALPKKTWVYRYCWNSLIALDNAVNAWVFLGDPDETISSHAYKGSLKGHKGWKAVTWCLEKLDPGHGAKYVEWDEGTETGESPLFNKEGK